MSLLGFDNFGSEQLAGLGNALSDELDIWTPPEAQTSSLPDEPQKNSGNLVKVAAIVSIVFFALYLSRD